jgi:GNAT superfamily N-acetyltransferase
MPAPAQYRFVTSQGQEICIRSMKEDDTDHLIDLFAHLSARSRYQRFHRWLDHPEPERIRQGAEQLTHIPAGQGLALLGFALVAGAAAPVAVARYVRLSDTVAEPALTIRDDFQGQGLGTYLFGILIAAAQAEHLHQFAATIQPSNQGALRLIKQAGLPTSQTVDDGQIVVTIDLQPIRHLVEVAA